MTASGLAGWPAVINVTPSLFFFPLNSLHHHPYHQATCRATRW